MSAETTKSISLSSRAIEIISLMREEGNTGLNDQIEVIEELLFELIRDKDMGEDNNRKYINYLVDVIELTRSLMTN